ncbi:sulfite exporter TauE/SafE family protein [Granulosicoccus antarcticus]|uniref:Probable membrane transporter protein n=1 Tax=Granulosicoccus antarcticus IMCC3135 TaxID=1192854 RepID=A0A2Z2NNP7_9GAMM|nr:sulfite exporter TauE/SafE family protein [Granulosicoccus antarcticus]ASJ72853.1 hypothetical protein IMCC3135_13840 [Granulosicoccus antarcticus IMCC3135]
MPIEFYLYLIAGALAGGFINGLAGFGTALFALGFWLQILEPGQAVPMVLVSAIVPGLQGAWIVRTEILNQPKRLMRFLLPGLVGVPLGVSMLALINPDQLKVGIGVIMVLYGGYFSFRNTLPKLEKSMPFVDAFIGLIGGILGGLASLSGALPVMWCSLQAWSKSDTRAVLQTFNLAILTTAAVAFLIKGMYTQEVLKLIAVTLPVSLLSAQAGLACFKHLNTDHFQRLIIFMMFISGTALLIRGVI